MQRDFVQLLQQSLLNAMPEIDGVDLVGINAEGKVASLSIHSRPLRAVLELQNRLAPALAMPVLKVAEEL